MKWQCPYTQTVYTHEQLVGKGSPPWSPAAKKQHGVRVFCSPYIEPVESEEVKADDN